MCVTPLQVPFRLTRDIIDGMGVMGVEGVFRRCCEETLSVMRTNKVALLTIIEVWPSSIIYYWTLKVIISYQMLTQVFIHDPLYKWALSPLKALQRQKVCFIILQFLFCLFLSDRKYGALTFNLSDQCPVFSVIMHMVISN